MPVLRSNVMSANNHNKENIWGVRQTQYHAAQRENDAINKQQAG